MYWLVISGGGAQTIQIREVYWQDHICNYIMYHRNTNPRTLDDKSIGFAQVWVGRWRAQLHTVKLENEKKK